MFREMEKQKNDNELIATLLNRLSSAFGRTLSTSADYQHLSEIVSKRVGQYVSATTLKRLGGYLNEPVEPRRSTLDLLSRSLGYRDFTDFADNRSQTQGDSDPSAGHWLDVSGMRRGERIELTWFPDRRCVIRFLGDDLWEILESEATRLTAGQRFRCSHIIEGEPLQVLLLASELKPSPAAYVCGRVRGVRFRVLD